MNSRTSRDVALMHLLRSLLMVGARHSLVFSAVHIAGRCNRIADALSRFHWQANASSSSAAIVGGTFLGRLEQHCLHYMYAGLAASTRKTYRTAQRTCFNFCEMSGFVHANGSPCPANERTLCLFAAFLAESINHASIKVYLPSTSSCSPRYQAQSRRQLFYSPSHHCIHLKIIRNSLDLRQHDHLMFWAACR